MNPKIIRPRAMPRISRSNLLAATLAFALASPAFATSYTWNGNTSTEWTTAGNWDANGVAPTGAAAAGHRLNAQNSNSARPVTYTVDQGNSTFGGSGVRAVVIGNNQYGSMVITGGTFSALPGTGAAGETDVIGNGGSGTGVLTIDGGNFVGSTSGTTVGVLGGGSGSGTLNVNSGNATLSVFTLNGGSGTVNLNGGTLAMDRMVFASGTNTVNFNGGTLKARISSTTFMPDSSLATARVMAGGAIIDTDANDVTIGEALVEHPTSSGGGITKIGDGILTLGAPSTTTGPADLTAGGLIVTAGATSWAPSSLTLSGDALGFAFGAFNAANPVPIDTPTLNLNGTLYVDITGTSLPFGGEVKLLEYGTKTGTGTLEIGNLPPGVDATVEENTVDGYFYLNIIPPASTEYVWSAGTGNWDDISANWNGNADIYSEPAVVLFPNLTDGGTVTLTAPWSPLAMTINNADGNDYLFEGEGISGTLGLVKQGTGSASFANALTYSGDTLVQGGKLALTGTTPLPSNNISIATDAVLSYANSANTTQGAPNASGLIINGQGTLEKSGAATVTFANGVGQVKWELSPGALIDVREGKMVGGSNNNDIWGNNKASLNIETGATFDAVEANVTVDALTGGGTYQAGYFGPRELIVGIDNGSGTFSGSIQSNGGHSANSVMFIKVGSGEQTLDGAINIFNFYTGTTLRVNGGTLNISPVNPSVIGDSGSDVFVSPAQGNVSTVNQSSGTIATRNLSLGQQGAATFTISGGIINAQKIEMAFTGPTTGAAAVAMNVTDTAEVNVFSNGGILMGQYYGRPVTVTQTGGQVVCFSNGGSIRGGTNGLRFLSGNQTSSYNLEGGLLSIPAISRAASGGGFGGGNGTINFNGGIFQITSAAFSVPVGTANGNPVVMLNVLGDDATPDSGAIIDNYGLDVAIAAGLRHGSPNLFDGGLKLASSVAGGSLTLQAENTYTGDTTVLADNTLVLANTGSLKFVLDGTDNTRLTGAGTVEIQGAFVVDTNAAALTNGQTWTLVDVDSLSEDFQPSFTLVGFSEDGTTGVHTMMDGQNTWTFNEEFGTLTLSIASAGGYDDWIDGFTVSDPAPGADPEKDGMDNLLEYVLNGNPSISDVQVLPQGDASGDDFVFTFTRREESAGDTTQVLEYGTDLDGWAQISITPPVAPQVTLGTPSGGLQLVTVTLPKSLGLPDGSLFARLRVVRP